MQESDKHKLEGLLKARSADLRQGRRPRTPRTAAEGVPDAGIARLEDRQPSADERPCAECGRSIDARRLRAMPRATRCLRCQRAAEQPTPHS